jgi:SAM-dependent methyltransferase
MADDATERAISAHYTTANLTEAIAAALRAAGKDLDALAPDDLIPLDQFHSFGLASTLELARRAGIAAGERVLDVGGGIGGPARFLASHHECHVTVLDLTPAFVATGEMLTAWTRLTDRVSFVCGSALEMPSPAASFDLAWTQNAAMNIADKPRLYGEIARVLRPGGRLAFFGVTAGPKGSPHFPVPWASEPAYSFLLPPEEVRQTILAAGFRERSWLAGPELVALLEGLARDLPPELVPRPSGLATALLMGAEAETKIANSARNTREGRTTPAMGVFERV